MTAGVTRSVGFARFAFFALFALFALLVVTWFLAAAGPASLSQTSRDTRTPRIQDSGADLYIPDPRHPCRCQKRKDNKRNNVLSFARLSILPLITLTMASDVAALEAEVEEFKLQVGPSLLALACRRFRANLSYLPSSKLCNRACR
jgi:hypothetical protein